VIDIELVFKKTDGNPKPIFVKFVLFFSRGRKKETGEPSSLVSFENIAYKTCLRQMKNNDKGRQFSKKNNNNFIRS